MKIVADLEQVEIPQFMVEGCSSAHKIMKDTLKKCSVDLIETDGASVAFTKSIKRILEAIETNLKLLKGLKTTEAKKYEKEVMLLQDNFQKLMAHGRRTIQIQVDIEKLERHSYMMKRSKNNQHPKNKVTSWKVLRDHMAVLDQASQRSIEEFEKAKNEAQVFNQDFNETTKFILETFNVHTESIDSRLSDSIEFYKRKLNEFAQGLKIWNTPLQSTEVTPIGKNHSGNHFSLVKQNSRVAESISGFSDEVRRRRFVSQIDLVN